MNALSILLESGSVLLEGLVSDFFFFFPVLYIFTYLLRVPPWITSFTGLSEVRRRVQAELLLTAIRIMSCLKAGEQVGFKFCSPSTCQAKTKWIFLMYTKQPNNS